MIACLFARKWQTAIWSWVVCSGIIFTNWLRSCHLGISLFCFLCCPFSKFLIFFVFFVFYEIFPDVYPPFSPLNFFLSMKYLDFSFNLSRRSLHLWTLARPEYSPFLRRPEPWIYNILAWNHLEVLTAHPPWLGDEENF